MITPEAVRLRPPPSPASEPPRAGGHSDGVRFINDSRGRSPTPSWLLCKHSQSPAGADRGWPRQGRGVSPVWSVAAERADAAILIGESGRRSRHCSREAACGVERAPTLEAGGLIAPTRCSGVALGGWGQPVHRTVLLSQPPAKLRHVRRLRRARSRPFGMPLPRWPGVPPSPSRTDGFATRTRNGRAAAASATEGLVLRGAGAATAPARPTAPTFRACDSAILRRAAARDSSRSDQPFRAGSSTGGGGLPASRPKRERHEPDYVILVCVIARLPSEILMCTRLGGFRLR